MDSRRAELGRLVTTARESQGFNSQAAFATAAGVSPRSIFGVEKGEKVGRKVLEAVCRGLGWPSRSGAEFLATGDASVLAPAEPSAQSGERVIRNEIEAAIMDIDELSLELRWAKIFQHRRKFPPANPPPLRQTGR